MHSFAEMRRLKRFAAPVLILVLAGSELAAGEKPDKKHDPSQIGSRDVGKGVNFYSLEKEIALGRQLAQEVQRQAKILDDPIVGEYINRIGQNLVRNSDARVPFTFQVIESDQPNAFAFPGGYIFLHTGLIKMADEEAELAGAMAHEIAHVAARHMTRQATKAEIANLASLPLGVLLGGWTGYGVRQVSGIAGKAAFLKFSRQDESEADSLGVQYMYAAGYDPVASVSLFEKLESLERKKPGTLARVFASHPPDGARLQKVQEQIGRYLPAKPEYVVTTSVYAGIRQRLFDLQAARKAGGERRTLPTLAPRSGEKSGDNSEPDERPTIRRRDWVD